MVNYSNNKININHIIIGITVVAALSVALRDFDIFYNLL
jgi:hypothetical protein